MRRRLFEKESFMGGRISGQAKQSHGEIAGAASVARRFLAVPVCALMGAPESLWAASQKSAQTHPPSTSRCDKDKVVQPPAPHTLGPTPNCHSTANRLCHCKP
ncbi:hypothetical protein VZT92_014683 [Zoarces viviparus]|uniref:Uncharacterized protein n=1 Tax=Zoarces viviparus TaxID=48416 RepID=A0AAW1F200_ZOAVI